MHSFGKGVYWISAGLTEFINGSTKPYNTENPVNLLNFVNHILNKTHITDSQKSQSTENQTKKCSYSRFFIVKSVFAVALISLTLANPLIANAGVFSYLSIFFVGKILAQDKENIPNSQNASLLQPSFNPDPNSARGGGDITVVDGTALLPETGPSGTIADIIDENKADQISIYVVRPGDSISNIAKMFNVSVNTIVWANDLPSSKSIKEGQTLVILPISGIKHTVAKGETIKSIAT